MRCAWVLGCPSEIMPVVDAAPPKENEPIHAKHVYKGAFEELFPDLPVPEVIGVTCCSQFAARRETIRKRPKKDYMRYRQWLIESTLPDDLSGRVLEYSWHSEYRHCADVQYATANETSHLRQGFSALSHRRGLLLSQLRHVQHDVRRGQVRRTVYPTSVRDSTRGLADAGLVERGQALGWPAMTLSISHCISAQL